MASPPQNPRYSIAEYLESERNAPDRHEYRDGEILSMAGGNGNHSLIIMNIGGELHNRLKGKPCRVYDSNLRVRIPGRAFYAYPDLTVICGPREPDSDDPKGETFINPRLIVEVISPTSEAYDRGTKFGDYLQLDSLQEYVLVSQSTPRVETFFRRPDGSWLFSPSIGLEAIAKFQSLQIELPLADIFAGVDFPA